MKYITNPILPGFNPDPSILRVGDDYYIATSTFEWFPGVQIHHSRDLIHWQLIARPLNRISQLDMRGNPCSGGIWAPCLSYDNGVFYLIYTDVKHFDGTVADCHNYLVTATEITGEWSEPVYLNSSGFDPSLFHDDDGRKWLLNMVWDFRKGRNRFGGILLQEYSVEEKKLIGPVYNIFKGTKFGLTEAPHLYKHKGYYYLMTAEGGTFWEHAVTMARSQTLIGPYEVDPENPVLTSRYDCTLELQRAGHASLVETQNGEWYLVHLCGRPMPSKGFCVLGRETAIQKVVWTDDGWLRLAEGGNKPFVKVPAPDLSECPWPQLPERDDFDSEELNIHFQTLRIPLGEDVLSLKERPGYLRLKGRESLHSRYVQSLVARRQQSFVYTATTCVEFNPESFQQMAGLVCIYNSANYYYLCVTHEEGIGKCLKIIICDNNTRDEGLEKPIKLNDGPCYLRVVVNYDKLQFYYSIDGVNWTAVGDYYDASKLSDEYLHYIRMEGFTGAFVGLCCQDLSGRRKHADFDFFEYYEGVPKK
ncbi:MAG TPA: glycoside hydrolase family 43 protein [Bacillota bacterium]|nr:glycoside hydrolase family 43 protein [Bacillota bacterium]HOL09272.1 glycoside hydrolase family 43 protein [Bacillota bacterium]HPO96935.1 glycoside hydrolase family 43 protein [Bacillota bacterium]